MKKFILRIFTLVVALAGLSTLTSCDDYIGYDYDYGPPVFYDRGLVGSWELVSINGGGVAQNRRNWFTFNGGGVGTYYYYSGGRPYRQRVDYWCEAGYSGTDYLYLSYSGASPDRMQYWFTNAGSFLWMEWYTSQGRMRYGYQRINNWAGWSNAPASPDSGVLRFAPGREVDAEQ